MEHEFKPFDKIPRLKRSCVITEKIDGTNALVFIADDFTTIKFGSRSRWVTPESDNHGFARWGEANKEELLKLGPGYHYGEWWGAGIQRRYGLAEKRLSLFNTTRWTPETLPACCSVVPVLAQGPFGSELIESTLDRLRTGGSVAAPGFMDPEGIVVYHTASRTLSKVMCKNDDTPKGE